MKEIVNITGKELRESNPTAFTKLKRNYNTRNFVAREKGIPEGNTNAFYNLEFPTHCIITGIELDYDYEKKRPSGGDNNAPSYDRIIPEKGYIEGNVRVVSFLGNRILNSINDQENSKSIIQNLKKFLEKN